MLGIETSREKDYMMTSCDLIVDFPLPLMKSKPRIMNHLQRIYVDLFWVRQNGHGYNFIKHFNLKETNEIPGLTSLRAIVNLRSCLVKKMLYNFSLKPKEKLKWAIQAM